MRLSNRNDFLLLGFDASSGRRNVRIVGELADAIEAWTSSTRVSPIWPARLGDPSDAALPLHGRIDLIFLGPVAPARVAADIEQLRQPGVAVWITAGAFNVVVGVPRSEGLDPAVDVIVEWATKAGVPYELWLVEDGIVTDQKFGAAGRDPRPALVELAKTVRTLNEDGFHATHEEYYALMATAVARAAATYPPMYDDLLIVNDETLATLEDGRTGVLPPIDAQTHLLSINAALSRYSSQAFSGTSPIEGTECHFWIHSLLGIGVANIGLAELTAYIQSILGEARLPDRLWSLAELKVNVPSLGELTGSDPLLEFDLMSRSSTPLPAEAVSPLITYFSGRDGFSSHIQTISAPLTTVSECNSYRYNLLTITHELTHIFIHAVLPVIFPDFNDPAQISTALEKLKPGYQAPNWLDALRQLLLESLVSMDMATGSKGYTIEDITEKLPGILKKKRRESQEILVHTFDFMYFYGGDAKFYITGIWQSWCAIPGIRDRVPEYVMRCLCAISASSLREEPERLFQASVRELKETLEALVVDRKLMSAYAEDAVSYLHRIQNDPETHDRSFKEYYARLGLTRLTAIFLHSKTLGATLFGDPLITAGPSPYDGPHLVLGLDPVGNPLRFLRENLKEDPSPSESLWVLHHLAFNQGSRRR